MTKINSKSVPKFIITGFQVMTETIKITTKTTKATILREWHGTILKGALDNFSLTPLFFPKKKKVQIFVSVEVYLYVVTMRGDCILNLTCSFNSVTKIYDFFFQ